MHRCVSRMEAGIPARVALQDRNGVIVDMAWNAERREISLGTISRARGVCQPNRRA